MTRSATGMPNWVKISIGLGVVFALVVAVAMAMGHGPWQHAAMAGMHG